MILKNIKKKRSGKRRINNKKTKQPIGKKNITILGDTLINP